MRRNIFEIAQTGTNEASVNTSARDFVRSIKLKKMKSTILYICIITVTIGILVNFHHFVKNVPKNDDIFAKTIIEINGTEYTFEVTMKKGEKHLKKQSIQIKEKGSFFESINYTMEDLENYKINFTDFVKELNQRNINQSQMTSLKITFKPVYTLNEEILVSFTANIFTKGIFEQENAYFDKNPSNGHISRNNIKTINISHKALTPSQFSNGTKKENVVVAPHFGDIEHNLTTKSYEISSTSKIETFSEEKLENLKQKLLAWAKSKKLYDEQFHTSTTGDVILQDNEGNENEFSLNKETTIQPTVTVLPIQTDKENLSLVTSTSTESIGKKHNSSTFTPQPENFKSSKYLWEQTISKKKLENIENTSPSKDWNQSGPRPTMAFFISTKNDKKHFPDENIYSSSLKPS